MPFYFYTAKSQQGETLKGETEAKDEQDLARTIRRQGLFLISSKTESSVKKKIGFSLPSIFNVSTKEKLFFIRNLQVMVSAGIPLPRAINVLVLQAKNKRFCQALSGIGSQLLHGKSLSESMQEYPDIFPELFQNMIKIGEESGTLEQSLKNLNQQLGKEEELKSKIVGALIYPLVVVSAMILIGVLMLITVVPQLAETFKELEVPLPLMTQLVVGLGLFMSKYWYFLLLIAIIVFALWFQIIKTKSGRRAFDRTTLRLPVVSNLIKETNSASFTRTLGSLISAGVPLVRALEIIAGTMSNIYFKEAIIQAVEKVRKGARLSESLKPYDNLYFPIVIQMLEVGEETGETSKVLSELADFLEEETINSTKNLASLIEPLLMLGVGAAVGFFAISMLQPMYSMLEAV